MVASTGGMYISLYHNIPSGAAIVLVSSSLFLLTLLFSPSQGILTRPRSGELAARLLRRLGLGQGDRS